MTVKRKTLLQKEKKEKSYVGPLSRKAPRGAKLDNLPDAIIDGKLDCKVGDELVVYLKRGARVTPIVHTVKNIKDDLVELWDEDQHRWFSFKIDEAVKAGLLVKILFRVPASQLPGTL